MRPKDETLRPGDRVMFNRTPHVVVRVSFAGATIRPEGKQEVTIDGRTFYAKGASVLIASNSPRIEAAT